MENAPLSPRAPLSPVGRLTAYGKLAFGHLPTGLGKPAAGFPQPPSFDDDPSLLSMHISNCRHRTKVIDAGHEYGVYDRGSYWGPGGSWRDEVTMLPDRGVVPSSESGEGRSRGDCRRLSVERASGLADPQQRTLPAPRCALRNPSR